MVSTQKRFQKAEDRRCRRTFGDRIRSPRSDRNATLSTEPLAGAGKLGGTPTGRPVPRVPSRHPSRAPLPLEAAPALPPDALTALRCAGDPRRPHPLVLCCPLLVPSRAARSCLFPRRCDRPLGLAGPETRVGLLRAPRPVQRPCSLTLPGPLPGLGRSGAEPTSGGGQAALTRFLAPRTIETATLKSRRRCRHPVALVIP